MRKPLAIFFFVILSACANQPIPVASTAVLRDTSIPPTIPNTVSPERILTPTTWLPSFYKTETPTPTTDPPPRIIHCKTCDISLEKEIFAWKIVPSENDIWFGSHGLYRFDMKTWAYYPVKGVLKNDNVTALAIEPNSGIWVGTPSGAAHFDGTKWVAYTENSIFRDTYSFQAIAVAKDKSVWFATYEGGLIRFDKGKWTYQPEREARHRARDVIADPNEGVWASATMYGGLVYINGKDVHKYDVHAIDESINLSMIRIAPDGSLWLLVSPDQLIHFKDGVVKGKYDYSNGLPMHMIGSIAVAPDGKVWISRFEGEEGIASFDGKGWTLYDQLPFKVVMDIAVGPDDAIWLATEWGVYRFVPPE